MGPDARPVRIAALLTCHNRRELTLACLEALDLAYDHRRSSVEIVLVDDGSTDGTAQAVRQRFPEARILRGEGDLFWNRGMHRAFQVAFEGRFDAYVWLNDDTVLSVGAVDRLLDVAAAHQTATGSRPIVVGTTVDPSTGAATYGGHLRASRLNPLCTKLIAPPRAAAAADTFNGNIVLIPDEAARRVGNLDPVFEHAMGDMDYGFRARKLAVPILVAPGVSGFCRHNAVAGGPFDATLGVRQRFRLIRHRRYLPWRSWSLLARRHGGAFWPLLAIWPYARVLAGGLIADPRKSSRHGLLPGQ